MHLAFSASWPMSVLKPQGFLQDYSRPHKRMQKEAQLRASESRFRRLFETTKDGILILDFSTGQITDANPFISELLGYSSDKLCWPSVA